MNLLEILTEESRKLASLMSYPHPGLATWCHAVQVVTEKLAATLPQTTLDRLAGVTATDAAVLAAAEAWRDHVGALEPLYDAIDARRRARGTK